MQNSRTYMKKDHPADSKKPRLASMSSMEGAESTRYSVDFLKEEAAKSFGELQKLYKADGKTFRMVDSSVKGRTIIN